jgi:hypothetical protein
LLNAHDKNLSKPFAYQGKIYFSSGLTGIENIFELDPVVNIIKQITNARFGAFDPFVANDTLYFSNYDKNGYEIWKTSLASSLKKPVRFSQHPVSNSIPHYFKAKAKASIDSLITIDTAYKTFFWNKLLYAGGWIPSVIPPEIGIEFYTLNLERTFKSTIGINYNFNENVTQSKFIGSYAKHFPIVNGTVLHQARRLEQAYSEYSHEELPEVRTTETVLGAGLEVPLNLTQGVYFSTLTVKGDFNHHMIKYLEDDLIDLSFNSAVAELRFERIRPKAMRQIQTPFGQTIHALYKQGLDSNDPVQFFANGQLFFPGLCKTHSLNVRASYERNENSSSYRYLSLYMGSRGYQYYPFDESRLLSLNYEIPILYPDLYLRAFAGLTRVRLNAYMDYSIGQTSDFEQKQRSFGGELIFDLRLFRAFNMDLRFQLAHRMDTIGREKPFFFNIAVNYFELLN